MCRLPLPRTHSLLFWPRDSMNGLNAEDLTQDCLSVLLITPSSTKNLSRSSQHFIGYVGEWHHFERDGYRMFDQQDWNCRRGHIML